MLELAFQTPDAIGSLQDRLLREHVAYAFEHSPFYRERLRGCGLAPEDLPGLHAADLAQIPLTEKSDLDARNDDFLAAPAESIVDVCLTSATSGDRPTALLQTRADLDRLAHNELLALTTAGLTPRDTLYICAALDKCFMAGLAYFMGAVRLGARAVRGGSGAAAQHWQMIRATGATALIGVPSLMRRIGEAALERGEDPRTAGLQRLLAIGEPTRGRDLKLLPAAEALERMWGAPLYSTYASTELATTFCECPQRVGGHLSPELVLLEVLNAQGNMCEPGEVGEVIVTPLGVKGMPLVRFRTGDVAYYLDRPCRCGRQSIRLGPILGRKNQMLKYKGTTVFPTAILAALEGLAGVVGGYVEAHRFEDGTDRVVVKVALRDGASDLDRVREAIQAHMRVTPEVERIGEEALNAKIYPGGKRKRVIFFDLRPL